MLVASPARLGDTLKIQMPTLLSLTPNGPLLLTGGAGNYEAIIPIEGQVIDPEHKFHNGKAPCKVGPGLFPGNLMPIVQSPFTYTSGPAVIPGTGMLKINSFSSFSGIEFPDGSKPLAASPLAKIFLTFIPTVPAFIPNPTGPPIPDPAMGAHFGTAYAVSLGNPVKGGALS